MIVCSFLPVTVDVAVCRPTSCAFDVLLGNVGCEFAPALVVGKFPPRGHVLLPAQPEKAAKRHDHIGDVSAFLVDHQMVNRANMLAFSALHVSSVDIWRGGEISSTFDIVHAFFLVSGHQTNAARCPLFLLLGNPPLQSRVIDGEAKGETPMDSQALNEKIEEIRALWHERLDEFDRTKTTPEDERLLDDTQNKVNDWLVRADKCDDDEAERELLVEGDELLLSLQPKI